MLPGGLDGRDRSDQMPRPFRGHPGVPGLVRPDHRGQRFLLEGPDHDPDLVQGRQAARGDTSGYRQARLRVPERFLEEIDARVVGSLDGTTRPEDRWHGLTLKTFDGTSIQLDGTAPTRNPTPGLPARSPAADSRSWTSWRWSISATAAGRAT